MRSAFSASSSASVTEPLASSRRMRFIRARSHMWKPRFGSAGVAGAAGAAPAASGTSAHGTASHPLNSRRRGSSHSKHFPSPTAAAVMVFTRFCAPSVPHRWVQGPQTLHSERAQSTSQACMLQIWVSTCAPQGVPPFGAWITTRSRDCVPPPQVRVHSLNGAHSPSLQSTGQGCRLHSSTLDSGGHGLPAGPGGETTLRVRLRVPVPHSTLQGPGDQTETMQS